MSDEEIVGPPIKPVEEKLITFYEDNIAVVRAENGTLYVPINAISIALGLSTDAQRRRVLRDEVLSNDLVTVQALAPDGRRRPQIAIPLEHLPGFLFGIESKRVKDELKDKVDRYRRECFRTLWRAFAVEPVAPALPALVPDDELTPAERNLQQAATVYQMAARQVELERRIAGNEVGLGELAARHKAMADYVRGFIVETRQQLGDLQEQSDGQGRRLGAIERGLVTSDPISNAQATQISQSVKLVASLIERRTGRRAFGMVYDTLYKQFEITTYKLLPSSDFEVVMERLRQWYDQEMGQLEKST